LRSFLVNRLSPLGADPNGIVTALDAFDTGAADQHDIDAILFHFETSIRRALIVSLGSYENDWLTADQRTTLVAKLLERYRNDPDAGIHGAVEWTLRQWNQQDKLVAADRELMTIKERGARRWFVNSLGQTFTVVNGPVEFDMGSPESESGHSSHETLHRVRIPRRYAIATKEVSNAQWQQFLERYPEFGLDESEAEMMERYSPEPDGPMGAFSWYIAAAFCNWLSERDGLPKDQWCYTLNTEREYAAGMTIPDNVFQRGGYRIPTEAEWEYACRSGSTTCRYYGFSPNLLHKHVWYQANSSDRARSSGSLLPNDLGLFDVLGNLAEWCQEKVGRYHTDQLTLDQIANSQSVDESPRILRGSNFAGSVADVRSASRLWSAPSTRFFFAGFRPVKSIP
jgi:formylglycine-generating enzyme required for sulfatase activity